MPHRNRRRLRTLLPALSALTLACASPAGARALAADRTPTGAAVVSGTTGGAAVGGSAASGATGGAAPAADAPVTGNATWFTGLGSPYGGCGLPQANLDSQDFVALNVFNTPHDYNGYPRPISSSDAARMGIFDNGHNCGRYVQVTIGDYCTGVNDGAPNQPFCRNGSWTADAYDGATLTMLVADSCADGNAWCRDDPYHLDLSQASLNRFVKNGAPVGDMYPNHWNNRHIGWQFVPAPGYTGDIKIGFLQNAQVWWPVIAVSHLPNGIHGVQYYDGTSWKNATMDGDMGQAYVIAPTTTGGRDYRIRVVDASDALIGGGRVYSFSLPCANTCGPAYTGVSYTTSGG
ncbi:expansin-like protein [Actinoallomurus rhizosphaericola]|uniref:expansin-like protein n=1 Tax=Actinoallomurus rhizosphaericola TaxID=2952536 RepID=UPI0020917CE6|nr:expansin-like protein [Actinoallomurus rhizosphaericola]MCO5992926.1 expansin-like protein [Actinoallomurus rhizosphaericola]